MKQIYNILRLKTVHINYCILASTSAWEKYKQYLYVHFLYNTIFSNYDAQNLKAENATTNLDTRKCVWFVCKPEDSWDIMCLPKQTLWQYNLKPILPSYFNTWCPENVNSTSLLNQLIAFLSISTVKKKMHIVIKLLSQ